MNGLKIISLGGNGRVTQNMYVYQYEEEILLVDCGIGFPDIQMPGVDILIPDISYVLDQLEQGKKIVGMILSHGHDDHIAATAHILPHLPNFPIYGSPLTAGFAEDRMREGGSKHAVTVIPDTRKFTVGIFTVSLIPVTHSVPDTRHIVIRTPIGVVYHGSDFKLDPTPVDGQVTDLAAIKNIGDEGVLCMTIDCLRVERSERTTSEKTVGPAIEKIMAETKGKSVVTLMSSHIHRIQQTIDAANKHGRKVTFIGRSVERNIAEAMRLRKIHFPEGVLIDKNDMDQYPDSKLCVIVAGSQGQEGSSMMRAIYGEHRMVKITDDDTVIFSADAIPGNELNYFGAIDELSRNGVHVLYPDIVPGLHQSGHASMTEQRELLKLVRPKYVMPIGGADRHRYKFFEFVAEPLGYAKDKVLLPTTGDVLEFSGNTVRVSERIELKPPIIDGLGIGDVGPVVLADRIALSKAGMVVIVLVRNRGKFDLSQTMVVTRGFIFVRDAKEVVEFIRQEVATLILREKKTKDEGLKRMIEKRLARKLYKIIQREPLIVPVILDR
ncbi:MAG: ribonuclease J [Candidatus Pacebacteria bacterium]|nr:ribonuclease J [Candidatus Paceibacterota bacterium]PIR59885.1 MAG: ribonuclease J [Candidatus Pacebacteria bacterium CG10_big_fil_rev_8_21_14_0_10_44_54]